MVSVSKKVVLAVVALVTVLLTGNIVQLVSSDDSGNEVGTESSVTSTTEAPEAVTTSTAAPDASTTTTTTAPSASTSTTTSVAGANGSGSSRTTSTTLAPGAGLFFEPLSLAVLHTRLSAGFTYESSVSVDDVESSGSGSIDLVGNRTSLVVDTGDDSTEIRQVGDSVFVNVGRLGASGSTWVALDTAGQSSEFAVKSARSLVRSLTPVFLLQSLASASNIETVATDSSGIRFRAKVGKAITAFTPLVDVIDPASGAGETSVDVWVDTTFHVSRIVLSSGDVSITHTLSSFGSPSTISAPAVADTAALDSASGRFLFGATTKPPSSSTTTHAVTANPSVEIDDGISRGTLGATSATGEALRFEFVDSSAGGKMDLGVVATNGTSTNPQSFTVLPYAKWLDQGPDKGSETFSVKIRETTEFGEYLAGLPLFGGVAEPVIDLLQDSSAAPRLASLNGIAVVAPIQVSTNSLAPADTPVAFTYRITSFDGVRISVNFFPASGLVAGSTASTVLEAAGLGRPGVTNPYAVHDERVFVPGPATLRTSSTLNVPDFNVVTWDQRGSYASGGTMQLVHAYYEARDVSEIISWVAYNTPATLNGYDDLSVGFVGGGAGGATQLVTAGNDPRVDAIVPAATWNSLTNSLAPFDVVDTTATRAFLAALDDPNIRISSQLRQALVGGIADGRFSDEAVARLSSSGVGAELLQLQAPILMIQSTSDRLFSLAEAVDTAQSVLSNPFGTPVKLIRTDGDESDSTAMAGIRNDTVKWLQKYVSFVPIPDSYQPNFRYWDQNGQSFDSNLHPIDSGFNDPTPVEATSTGATFQFGSSPSGTITLTARIDSARSVVGRPSVSFTYAGSGTARAVFARVIDATTGRALNPAATPIPVVLDGATRTVSVPLRDIVFSAGTGSDLVVEIKPANSSFSQSATGEIVISNVVAAFPIKTP
ncbi:MAG: CocE/NonD family hydrolase [Ilumatobacteraceae bacterium]